MRFLVVLWVLVEVLQIGVIAVLAIGYRNLQRKLERAERFEHGAPPSVTED